MMLCRYSPRCACASALLWTRPCGTCGTRGYVTQADGSQHQHHRTTTKTMTRTYTRTQTRTFTARQRQAVSAENSAAELSSKDNSNDDRRKSRTERLSPNQNPEVTIRGTVKKIYFRSEETGFMVAVIHRDDLISDSEAEQSNATSKSISSSSALGNETIVKVTGKSLVELGEGYSVTLTGQWAIHQEYGPQLAFRNIQIQAPATTDGLKRYLGSGIFPGIGPAIAERIVNLFGHETISVLSANPERIKEVKGLGEERAKAFTLAWTEKESQRELNLLFAEMGVTRHMTERLRTAFGDKLSTVIRADPYILTELHGVGFTKADVYALGIGIKLNDPIRISGAIRYVMKMAIASGHCFRLLPDIIDRVLELLLKSNVVEYSELNIRTDAVYAEILKLVAREKLVLEDASNYDTQFTTTKRSAFPLFRESERKMITDTVIQKVGSKWIPRKSSSISSKNSEAINPRNITPEPITEDLRLIHIRSKIERMELPACFLQSMWRLEDNATAHISRILKFKKKILPQTINNTDLSSTTSNPDSSFTPILPTNKDLQLSEEQRWAINICTTEKCCILTGGPGVGKTHTLRAIIDQWSLAGKSVILMTPTGRAANRLAEVTGRKASTVHRALEWVPNSVSDMNSSKASSRILKGRFKYNHSNPLTVDCCVVDEASMMDLQLMTALLAALPSCVQLLIVGDSDQLPSVGAGNVLNDLMNCGAIPVVRLKQIHRQELNSTIIQNAYAVNSGNVPTLQKVLLPDSRHPTEFSDSIFISPTEDEISSNLAQLVYKVLPARGFVPSRDLQVLSVQHAGVWGVNSLNRMLQNLLNPHKASKAEILVNSTVFRVHDRVVQLVNDYDKGIFNGEIGVITKIDAENRKIWVRYRLARDSSETAEASSLANINSSTSESENEFVEISYSGDELYDISIAWALTVHKSQGSEYPAVIFFIGNSVWLLQRSLIYTGMTRAKKFLVVCGAQKHLSSGIRKQESRNRYTLLRKRINDRLSASDLTSILPLAQMQSMDGEVEELREATSDSDEFDTQVGEVGFDNQLPPTEVSLDMCEVAISAEMDIEMISPKISHNKDRRVRVQGKDSATVAAINDQMVEPEISFKPTKKSAFFRRRS